MPRSLRARLGLLLLVGILVLVVAVAGPLYLQTRQGIVETALREQRHRQDAIAAGLARLFRDLESRAQALAWQIHAGDLATPQLVAQMQAQVLHDPDVASISVFLEPDNPLTPGQRLGIAVSYNGAGIAVRDFVATGYEFATRPWYLATLAAPAGYWSKAFFNDAAGGLDTINYDLPLLDGEGRAFGMIGVSVSLDRIAEVAQQLGLLREQRFLLADGEGRLLMVWEPALQRAYTLAQAQQRVPEAVQWVSAARLGGSARDERYVGSDDRGWLSYAPVRPPGWHLVTASSDAAVWAQLRARLWPTLLVAMLVVASGSLVLLLMVRRRLRPLRGLLHAAHQLPSGQIDRALRMTYADADVDRLARDLREAGETILQLQQTVERGASERAKLDQRELEFAAMHRLQMPDDRTFFGSRLECAWTAALHTAQPSSFSFYGFLATQADTCHFFLGMPRGGAVPGFVAQSQLCGEMPRLLRQYPEPGDALRELVAWIALERPEGMAFSILIGKIDLSSGNMSYACADHPAPVLLRGDQRVWPAARQGSEALSRDGRQDWERGTQVVRPGDRLLLLSASLFGDQRADARASHTLDIVLERWGPSSPGELLDALIASAAPGAGETRDRCAVMATLRHRD